ncbi:MAG: sigma 54-interacting transcriptional regulator [Giesbergeria sp.]|uniref:sigma-54 interaction domain-containing protein n=1 Tax=Giesbergeria sp. TaxID=2818473 RepID=UPI0026061366|nr:sigma-54-dependent Fis family transcriptional regulator [Giesbergeria sp.]MDD2609860.1 sigma 54-interacting transcriptional regulator [Giesbergeria sp.]
MPYPAPPAELLTFIEGMSEPQILLDNSYCIVAANTAYREQFSPTADVVGRKCYEVSHHFTQPCDLAGESCPLIQAQQSGQRERVLHLHHTSKGEEYVQIDLVPVRNAQGVQHFFVEKMAALPMARPDASAQGLIGRSEAFQKMLSLVARVAPSKATVLLLGESGTGKELVAHALHEASPRAHKALVPVDCSSLTESLFESELFGHEKGAFTGATQFRPGLVASANGGTLFLDEVGDIPLPMQVKLLRLLESGTYRRVGSTELRQADIRVVAATHRDLPRMVADGSFRKDLYYRLETFHIHLPPLRERREDIPQLAQALLQRIEPQRGYSFHPDALARLQEQPYPGNVRELRNVVERCILLCDAEVIEDHHVLEALFIGLHWPDIHQDTGTSPATPHVSAGRTIAYKKPSGTPEDLKHLLAEHQGSRAELARALGISERSLYRRLKILRNKESP